MAMLHTYLNCTWSAAPRPALLYWWCKRCGRGGGRAPTPISLAQPGVSGRLAGKGGAVPLWARPSPHTPALLYQTAVACSGFFRLKALAVEKYYRPHMLLLADACCAAAHSCRSVPRLVAVHQPARSRARWEGGDGHTAAVLSYWTAWALCGAQASAWMKAIGPCGLQVATGPTCPLTCMLWAAGVEVAQPRVLFVGGGRASVHVRDTGCAWRYIGWRNAQVIGRPCVQATLGTVVLQHCRPRALLS